MENLVAFKSRTEFYWRERDKEVDFVLKNREVLPVEVKYKSHVRLKEIKNLIKFMDEFKIKYAEVITEDYEGKEKVKGKRINFIPLWKWLL